ncbi:MAG: Uma2 family endonuclease [Chloroflexota bacterium]
MSTLLQEKMVIPDTPVISPAVPVPFYAPPSIEEPLLYGYRWRRTVRPDGTEVSTQVALTAKDFLNPQEGDVMPQSTLHETLTANLRDMLRLYFANRPDVTVFHDLIFRWGIPGLSNPAPDIAVVPNVRQPHKNRRAFRVKEEGTRPILVIEVVSPQYQREDLVDKVAVYERAGVQEYVILEQRPQGGQTIDLITGYHLVNGRYQPLWLEADGRLLLQTVGLYICLRDGAVILEDAITGERLLNVEEAAAARLEAEKRAEKEAQARAELEAQVAALQAEVARLKGTS